MGARAPPQSGMLPRLPASSAPARLNILPQKRWNVYGRENRLKVRRDEAQAEAEQAERDAAHSKAESEFRHAALLRRAHARSGAAADGAAPALPSEAAPDDDAIEAAEALRPGVGAPDAAGRTAVIPARAAQPAFDLVSFLQGDREAGGKAQHPEVAEARRREERARGDAKTRTSDARFDAQFAFGHRLAGEANLPWYAKAAAPSEQPEQPAGAAARELPSGVTVPEAGGSGRSGKERRREGKKERRKERKREREGGSKRKLPELDAAGAAALKDQLWERLRREREEREAAEREKARQAVAEATGAADGGPVGKRYHGAYGNRRQ